MNKLTTSYIAKNVNGKLFGPNKDIKGIFNFINSAQNGDAIIRHWINGTGIKMAFEKGASCVITQNPMDDAMETAEKLGFPIIITDKIELANAFALNWAIKKFAGDSFRVVVTGTNGKSTTAHMIYTILKTAGFSIYSNTDAKSEFNTLIDPMVARQIAELDGKINALVIEVSEVQGWLNKIMKDHACIMTSAIDPDVVVITNVALDHIGLINSMEEAIYETSGAVKALQKDNGTLILNFDDENVRKMEDLNPNKNTLFFGDNAQINLKNKGIYYNNQLIIEIHELPFKSHHFVQNIMAAVGAALALDIDKKIIKRAISTYIPLKRRFIKISEEPCIIDDFAHNPDGIKSTIKNTGVNENGNFYIVVAIRGSRGEVINQINAEAIAESLKNIPYKLIVTNSSDVVDDLNIVKSNEKKVFIDALDKEKIRYIFYEKLYDALKYVINISDKKDTILLIGAQGMDPASELLEDILSSKN